MKSYLSIFLLFSLPLLSADRNNYQQGETIDIDDRKIGNIFLLDIFDALLENKSLRELRIEMAPHQLMTGYTINDVLLEKIGRLLARSSTLKKLYSMNLIFPTIHPFKTPKAAQTIFKSLIGNSSITSLLFSVAGLGERGSMALADLLEKNHTLEEIVIEPMGYVLSRHGVAVLSNALKTNTSLKKFTLRIDLIEQKHAQALVDALRQNKTLNRVSVYCRYCDAQVEDILQQAERDPSSNTSFCSLL